MTAPENLRIVIPLEDGTKRTVPLSPVYVGEIDGEHTFEVYVARSVAETPGVVYVADAIPPRTGIRVHLVSVTL